MARSKRASGATTFTVDTTGLRKFARGLRDVAPLASTELKGSLRGCGELVAEEARIIAKEYSDTVPGTVKVSGRDLTTTVSAGKKGGPLAYLMENGNPSNPTPQGTTFKHKVFGHKRAWATQAMHPFLAKASRNKQAEVADKVAHDINSLTDRMLGGDFG